jgi:hypothetical protein
MRYFSTAVFCVGILLCSAASAATVDSIKGRILLNRGDGFQVLAAPTMANSGDKVMANPGGSAKLRYADGCVIDIRPGTVVSVGEKSPCTAPYLGGLEGPVVQPGPPYFLIGAGIAAVTFGALCGNDVICEEEHHHRRQVTKPASN